MKPSFKQFLDNDAVILIKTLESNDKISTIRYRLIEYKRFPINNNGKRVEINLKPGIVIAVKWLLQHDNDPLALRIWIDGAETTCNFSGKKLDAWLQKNTEIISGKK